MIRPLIYAHTQLPPGLRELIEPQLGLLDDSLVEKLPGEYVIREANRGVVKLALPHHNTTAYLKWTSGDQPVHLLMQLLRFCRPSTPALREMKLLQQLDQANLPAARPLGWGEMRLLGIPLRGFIITQAIPGKDLKQTLEQSDHTRHRKLWKKAGHLLGSLHRHGFYQTVRTKDVIVASDVPPNESRWQAGALVLIDREARYPYPKRFSPPRCIQGLARCLAKHLRSGQAFGADDRRCFLRAYLRALPPERRLPLRQLVSEVEKALIRIHKHRRYALAAQTPFMQR